MGCFLGCFGGAKENRCRKKKTNRASPHRHRSRVKNVQQENAITVEQSVSEINPATLVPELSYKPEGVEEQLSPSPKKRVTFNSNVTTYEHVAVHESIDSLPDGIINDREKKEDFKPSSHSHSTSEDDNSVTSSVGSYPPNHRYHNARESEDEAEEYGDSDLDDLDDLDEEGEYDFSDEDIDDYSMESRTGNPLPQDIKQEIESPMMKIQHPDDESKALGLEPNARDRSGYVNSVLNPVENINQWKAVKSKGTHPLKQQKENFVANFEAPRIPFSPELTFEQTLFSFKSKSHQSRNANQEIAVDASLANWLVSPETTPSKKSGLGTISKSGQSMASGQSMVSEGCTPVRSFDDTPILGALTVEELTQISKSPSPRKSPIRSPVEMPIIGSVGAYWNH